MNVTCIPPASSACLESTSLSAEEERRAHGSGEPAATAGSQALSCVCRGSEESSWLWGARSDSKKSSLVLCLQRKRELMALGRLCRDVQCSWAIERVFVASAVHIVDLQAHFWNLGLSTIMKNGVLWDITPCDSYKNRCFGRN
jgi:hypothetical protein